MHLCHIFKSDIFWRMLFETMLAIILESHDSKHCVGTHLALRNGTQNYAKSSLLDLEGALLCLQEGHFGF